MKTSASLAAAGVLWAWAFAAQWCGVATAASGAPEPTTAETGAPATGPVSQEQIQKLIRRLGDKDYYARQEAEDSLARLGFAAFDALNVATTDDDLEIATRAKRLLRLMKVEWVLESDPPEVKKCLRDYDLHNGRLRQSSMEALAALPDGQGTAALCRLVRFENTAALSKLAALALLTRDRRDTMPDATVAETIRRNLRGCKRPAAAWLLAWSRLGDNPREAVAELSKLIGDEGNTLQLPAVSGPRASSPARAASGDRETSREIVSGLLRFQTLLLKKIGKGEEAMAAARRLVKLQNAGNPETTAELLDWLIEQKAWAAVDDLSRRFARQFSERSELLYMLAEAYDARGEKDRAEQAASRAFQLNPGKLVDPLYRHYQAALFLYRRGKFVWARREFEHIIRESPVGADSEEISVMAQTSLAQMLHDQCQDLDAARTLEKLLATINLAKAIRGELYGRPIRELRAQCHYFYACHWEAVGDVAKQREQLDKALAADAEDVDVLIACWQLAGQPKAYRAKIADLIQTLAARFREAIAEDPDNPVVYNQYAWLIGNTVGDFDEAVKCSLKSLELEPEAGGYYDTLAHCYFNKGDIENAVKAQTKAAELDPRSGLIRKKLDLFRKKLEEKKAAGKKSPSA